jgi:hypothetical protein
MSIDTLALKAGDVVWMRVAQPSASKTPIHELRFIRYWNPHTTDFLGREIPPERRQYARFADLTLGNHLEVQTPEYPFGQGIFWQRQIERMYASEQDALNSLHDDQHAALERAKRNLKSARKRVKALEQVTL